MPASKRNGRQSTKKIEPNPNKTLDHFFTKKGPSTSVKSISTPGACGPRRKPQTSCEHTPNEVILVESDDEPEVLIPQTGVKRRLPTEDSDVEIVDASSLTAKRPSGRKLPAERQPLSSSESMSALNAVGGSSTFIFGKPILLSPSFSELQRTSPIKFGSPGNLLRSDQKFQAPASTPSLSLDPSSAIVQEGTLELESGVNTLKEDVTHISIDLTGDDLEEWLTGDDEVETNCKKEDDNDDDDDEIEFVEDILLPAASLDHAVDPCPVAGQNLADSRLVEARGRINTFPDHKNPKSKPSQPEVDVNISSPSEPSTRLSAGGNAFSVLMSSFKENEVWKEAAASEDKSFRLLKGVGGRRKAPFYKVLQGMPIAVDAFRYGSIPGVTAYFLTHAHSDHYTNLSSSWKNGPIYCSEGTANLIIHMLSVDKKWVHPLPMDIPTVIPNTNGVQVTLIEANHCPGSCLFLFEGLQTTNAGDSAFHSPFVGSSRVFRYLHCGDFRASPRHVMHPAVKGKKIDHVYLDTTYLDPRYTFPPQPLVISACAELSRRLITGEPTTTNRTMKTWLPTVKTTTERGKKGEVLVVVGTYSIGKERIVKAIAHALNSKVYCDARKAAILRCQADAELDALLTSNPLEATVHLVPLGTIAIDRLEIYMERFKGIFTKAIGFRPTGWTFSPPAGTDQMPNIAHVLLRGSQKGFTCIDLQPSANSTTSIQVFPVPYSEHSSFYELTCFAMSLDWTRMIATVNVGSERSRGKMAKWVEKWEVEKKKHKAGNVINPRHEDYW